MKPLNNKLPFEFAEGYQHGIEGGRRDDNPYLNDKKLDRPLSWDNGCEEGQIVRRAQLVHRLALTVIAAAVVYWVTNYGL